MAADVNAFQQAMNEVDALYTKAIEVEPTCIEAYVNFAQMKSKHIVYVSMYLTIYLPIEL